MAADNPNELLILLLVYKLNYEFVLELHVF